MIAVILINRPKTSLCDMKEFSLKNKVVIKHVRLRVT